MMGEKLENKPGSGPEAAVADEKTTPIVISSETLFRQGRELIILHDGQEYRLRLTRLNKLILTK